MSTLDTNNEIFTLAVDLVNQSNRNIFLTGKAGTGKTTFLRYIKEHSIKQTAVVAPTGVAAINAGGSTIHSFFQLPFSPYLPDAQGSMNSSDVTNKHTLLGKTKLNRDRIKVLQQLELLIIDEISMVRCDVLDAIDVVLRHFRHRHAEPFGGVQVLVIGDMYQLPPVAVDEEWRLLSQCYQSPYFFDSRIMQQSPPVYVEFEKIYRQRDERFISLLNQVRNNALTPQGNQMLVDLYRPGVPANKDDGFIILTTHNYKADAINDAELGKLSNKSFSFNAVIDGDFHEKAFPADQLLRLKEGAQVMFIKNDKEKIKRYYNGKIGTVTRITDDGVFVQCKGETEEIEVQKETWENIRYSVNKQNNQLEEDVVGSFTQYPLRLAWAITIHKSQGLTFEKAVIDAGAAFAAGQVYVALSRCTSLDGIVLQSQITAASLRTDETIVHFSRNIASASQLKEQLQVSKKGYQQAILINVFEFSNVCFSCNELKKMLVENLKYYNEEGVAWITSIEERLISSEEVAAKFRERLRFFFTASSTPEENVALQEKTVKASLYFTKEFAEILKQLHSSNVVSESKIHAKNYNDAAKDLFTLIAEKAHLLKGFENGFSIDAYFTQKKTFLVPPFNVNAYATSTEQKIESPYPDLHFQLRQLRNKLCERKNLPIYMVAASQTIDEMAMYLPQNKEELVHISGFGRAKVQQYGDEFLQVINEYSRKYQLRSSIADKKPKKEKKKKEEGKTTTKEEKKPDTKTISYQLHKEGNSIADIAKIRNLSISTIEGHLSHFVRLGFISLNDLMSDEKMALIEAELKNFIAGTALSPIIEKLNYKVSYGELRIALAAKDHIENNAAG